MAERLQKVLASAGLGSRRACEQMIMDGRVEVNGQVVVDLPVLVGPEDRVKVDGKFIHHERKVYFLLNKPTGVVSTNSDPEGRKRAIDLLVGVRERVFPVGRLDIDSSGLLLLTNDGELSNRLTHPRYEAPKTYEAQVDGQVTPEQVRQLIDGVWLAEGKAKADRIGVVRRSREMTTLAITLTEGRNRQIRRMLAKLGHKVRRLRRVSIGRMKLAGVGVGRFRPLTGEELRYLKQLAGLAPKGEPPADAGPRRQGGRPTRTGQAGGRGRTRRRGPNPREG